MHVYLITHVHTEQRPGVAADAWRLSATGIRQAKELADAPIWDKIERVVVSAEPKTWLTVAEVVARRDLPVWIDSRFDELRRTGWIPNYTAQVAQVFAQPSQSVSGWEPVDSVRLRAQQGLGDLQRRFAGETLALVGHGICLSVIRAWLKGLPKVEFAAWQRLSFGSYALASLAPPSVLCDFPQSTEVVR